MSELFLAIEMLEQGDRAGAARELERILSTDIDNIAAWRLLAQAVTNPLEIKECYEQVLRLDPSDAEAAAALRDLGADVGPVGSVALPFFVEDIPANDPAWEALLEPQKQPESDTAPVKVIEQVAAAVAQSAPAAPAKDEQGSPLPTHFLEEDEEEDEEIAESRQPQAPSTTLLDNDAAFYTVVLMVVLVVLAVLAYIFRVQIEALLGINLPFSLITK